MVPLKSHGPIWPLGLMRFGLAPPNKQLQLTSMDTAIALLPQATRRVDSAAEPRR